MNAKACINGPRHKWKWVKNVNVGSMRFTVRGASGSFSLKGLYRCECGAERHGQFNPNGSDLRGIGGAA